jgi:hypothetical protein
VSSFISNTSSTVKRIVLTEGAQIAIPDEIIILHSEVVQNGDGVEVLELWVATPSVPEIDTSAPTASNARTIYTNTVIEEEDIEDYSSFEDDIERGVAESLRSYEEGWDEYDA